MGNKHQPTRTCIACRQARPKRELIRIVRSPEGSVLIDVNGKAKGRGAYLCSSPTCWERALKRRLLNQALRTEIEPEVLQQLQTRATELEQDMRDS